MKNKEITVLDQEIHINKDDYFSLTDIAKYKNPEDPRFVIQNWMRRIDTIQYIGLWEQLNNPNFNRVEFDTFRSEAGHNYFTMTPKKWIDGVNAIGIISKAGKYNGGTYAHKDAYLIDNGVSQQERLIELNKAAIRQMKVLVEDTLKLTDGSDEQ